MKTHRIRQWYSLKHVNYLQLLGTDSCNADLEQMTIGDQIVIKRAKQSKNSDFALHWGSSTSYII